MGQQLSRLGGSGSSLGLFSVSGSDRPAWRHQYIVAAVWHLKPNASWDRAYSVHSHPVQDETAILRLGNCSADRLATGMHAHRRSAESNQRKSGNRVYLTRMEVQ